MSYSSTMQFLRTGTSNGIGTEDPRYAGFSGGCGAIAGQYHDYATTFRVWGAPPIAGVGLQYVGAIRGYVQEPPTRICPPGTRLKPGLHAGPPRCYPYP
jgi:hypothetical protein